LKANRSVKILIVLAAVLSLLATTLTADAGQDKTTAPSPHSKQPSIHLGKIQVKGEKQIIKVLQSIKLALRQPYSDDPKLANVVVCRIKNDIGSHANQLLICATNHTLSERREVTRTALTVMISGPTGGGEDAELDVLHSMLMGLPDNYLHAPVNGPALQALLKKIPDPTVAEAARTNKR
jgi:hypothetical protein